MNDEFIYGQEIQNLLDIVKGVWYTLESLLVGGNMVRQFADWPDNVPFVLQNERSPGQLGHYSFEKRGGRTVIVGSRLSPVSGLCSALGEEVRFLPTDLVCERLNLSFVSFTRPPHASA